MTGVHATARVVAPVHDEERDPHHDRIDVTAVLESTYKWAKAGGKKKRKRKGQ